MKILYLSPYFFDFVHYQIIRLKEDFNIDFFMFFIQNKLAVLKSKHEKKVWNENISEFRLKKEYYKIISYWGLPKYIQGHNEHKRVLKKIIKTIKNQKFDLIHAHCLHPTGILAYKLAKELNIPYILTTHGVDFYNCIQQNGKTIYNNKIIQQVKTALHNAQTTIAVSEIFASDVKMFCPNANIIFNDNLYNKNIFKYTTKNKENQYINFLSVGGFIPKKNHLLLLNAFNILVKEYKNIRLTIIGSGKLEQEYNKFIKKNNLNEFIIIKGYMQQKELSEEYLKNDIFILPSNNEPFGIVCLEALACGMVVIASKTQGPLSIINDNVDGILFENNDLKDLIVKMKDIVLNKEKWKNLINNALLKAKLYENKHHEIYKIYKEILSKTKMK
jgi:glycosyltransferase involved in cell wall biosynthesis